MIADLDSVMKDYELLINITVNNLQLRLLQKSDVSDVYEIYSDEETSRYLLCDA